MESGPSSKDDSLKGRMRISAELFPNLILHVLACGGIGLDAEYGQKYQETLTTAEIDQIQEMAAGFDVTPPALAGPFFQALFQIPCYFPAETIEDIETIYKRMIKVVREGNLSPLTRSYPQQMDRFANYIPPQLQKHFLASIWTRRPELEKAIMNFRQILKAVYDRHYQPYWLEAREKIEGIGADIKERLGGKNVVKAWESIVEREFPYPYFHAVLCEPTRYLGTSLLAEKDIFGATLPLEIVVEAIVHEIGTHIMPIYTNEPLQRIVIKDQNGLVRVVEAACQVLRRPILEELDLNQRLDLVEAMGLAREKAAFTSAWEKEQAIVPALLDAYHEVQGSRQ